MASVKLTSNGEKDYIEKFDNELDSGLTFSPTTDTSKAKAVAISDAYTSSVFSAVAYTPLVTLDASGRNNAINLIGNAQKNKITGGKGADTLMGGDGADNLTGGDGADLFITSLGKDVIADYSASQGDVIMLNGVTPTKVKVSKQNVVITNSDKSTFTITNGKGQKLNVIDSNGNAIHELNQAFGDTDLIVEGTGTSIIDTTFNTSIKNIDASKASVDGGIVSGNLHITGNSKVNSIVGSNYTNNIIEAGAGKDTLTGGSGTTTTIVPVPVTGGTYTNYESTVYLTNTFVFSEGNGTNVITNFQSGIDKIQIKSGSVTGYKIKGDDVIFTIALNNKKKTTVTVQNTRNRLITFLRADGQIDTGNTKIYRDTTDYIVTTQATVSTALVDVNDKLGDKVKLIDASTSEYTPTVGTYLEGNKVANNIKGSRYSDTITGGAGKDTLTGGHSSVDAANPNYDLFLYYSGTGNDIITDYIGTSDTSMSDIIKLANPDTTISTSALNTKKGANDVVLTVTNAKGKSKSTLTLKGAQDTLVTIVKTLNTLGGTDSEETIAPQKYGNTNLKVGVDAYPIEHNETLRVVDTTFNSKVVTLDGSSADGNLYLIGNSGKNFITGSAAGSNTLRGGKGNDTLNGTNGVVDTFVYDTVDGTDAIVSLEAGTDIIKMASTDVHITASTLVTKKGANDVQLTIGKSKVVLKGIVDTMAGTNAKGKAITLYNAPKLTIDRGDGTYYKMTYANELAKIEDDDVEQNGILDFTASALVATIDAGAVILDSDTVSAGSSASVSVEAKSSTKARAINLGIVGSAKNNTIIGASNSRTHGTDADNMPVVTTMTGGKGNDAFIMTPGGDILITDYNTNAKKEADIIKLLDGQALKASSSVEGSTEDLLLIVTSEGTTTTMDNHITVKGGLGQNITIVDADGKSNTQQYGVPYITIDDKSSNNIMADGGVLAVIDGGRKKAISITSTIAKDANGNDHNISIQAGSGNDTINGGPANSGVSTLTGGAGKDIFYHTNGTFQEIITDYEPNKDKLRFIEGMNINDIDTVNGGSDIKMHFTYINKTDATHSLTEDGYITIQGGYGQKISIVKERSEEYVVNKKTGQLGTRTALDESAQLFGASDLIVLDADGATVDASDGANAKYVKVVDASSRSAKKPITIIGNATVATGYIESNTLIGGKGADTLITGFEGTTELTGGANADLFIYRGGDVTITDYEWNKKAAKSDVIMISSDTTLNLGTADFDPNTTNVKPDGTGKIQFNGEDITFTFGPIKVGDKTIGTNQLTIKNAKDKNISIVDATGATIGIDTIYANPYEWTVTNKTTPTTLKAVYIDSSDTAYNCISASQRSKGATLQAGFDGEKATTNYLVSGGKSADYLIGNSVVDSLVGNKGNDTLKPNSGGSTVGSNESVTINSANQLTGGDGKDVFYFTGTKDNPEFDIITDYQVGKDVIRLAEGLHIAEAEKVTYYSTPRTANLSGFAASVSASGDWELVKNKKKTVARNATIEANDVVMFVADDYNNTVGAITIWDAGGYSTFLDTGTAVSVSAIGAYKISVAQEYTNSKGKTAVNTAALDLVSSEIVVVNADGTTIDATPNVKVVNIIASDVKPKRTKAMYAIGNVIANSIYGSAKADTLAGGGAPDGSMDTLTGNAGADVFMLDGKGDVIITDYTSAKGNYDKIRLGNNVTLEDGEASGSDLVFTYTYGTSTVDAVTHHATVVGAASTKITLVGSDGKAGAQVYGSTAIEVANADGDKVDVGSNKNVRSIDASKRTKNVGLVGNENTSTILGGKKNDTLDASHLSSSVTGAYLDGGNGNDLIYGSTGADTVDLGAGNDTFISGGGNDTVTTGKGKDVIIYNGGNMVITDHDAKNDRLELQGTASVEAVDYPLSLIDYTIDSDMTVTLNLGYSIINSSTGVTQDIKTAANTIKILNGVDKNLLLTNAEGKTDTITLSDPNTLKVTNSDGANISPSANDTITTIDATKRSNPVTLTGNSHTTYIKGGTKTDTITLTATDGGTIQGGKGNDTMGGTAINAGKMFYAYTTGDGKDVITNYTYGDVIVLGSAKTTINEAKSKVAGSDYILTIGSGNITLKGCANTEIKVQAYGATTTTSYNIQSTTSPSSSFVEKLESELFADYNLAENSDLSNLVDVTPVTTDQSLIDSNSEFDITKLTNIVASNKIKPENS